MSYAEFPEEGQEKIVKGQDVEKQILLVREQEWTEASQFSGKLFSD